MNKEQVEEMLTFMEELAIEICNLKEQRCQNAGINWYDEWVKRLNYFRRHL